jgi:hypothetical protein
MYQRTWSCRAAEAAWHPRAHAKPWLLIEEASPVAQVSDFSRFRQAGFEVALCSGPDRSTGCPLVEGERCALADAADVVLFGLDLDDELGQRVLQAHLDHRPERPVVVELPRRRGAALPAGAAGCTVLPVPASVEGQASALWKALCRSGWVPATPGRRPTEAASADGRPHQGNSR